MKYIWQHPLESINSERRERRNQDDWQLWINVMIVSISDSLLTIGVWLDTTDFIGKWMEYNIPCRALVVCVDWMKDKFHMEESLTPITTAIILNTSGKRPGCSCGLLQISRNFSSHWLPDFHMISFSIKWDLLRYVYLIVS